MSDKEEVALNAEAETAEEHELSKEERLEAARKKFEELKKKKKKKKSKKSKEVSEEPASETEKTDAVDNSKEATAEPYEEYTENDTEKDPEKEIKDNEKDAEIDDSKEDAFSELASQTKLESEPEKDAEPAIEAQLQNTEETSTYVTEEIQESNEIEDRSIKDIQEVVAEEAKTPVETKQAVNNDDIESLKVTITQQANTIKKLRNENTDLKLEKLDLTDKITELEKELAQLRQYSLQTTNIAPVVPLKKAEQVFTKNDYASQSQVSFDNLTEDFRESLMVWKGWQVDMTEWNGVISGPKLAF